MTDDELVDAGFSAPIQVRYKNAMQQPLWLVGVVLARNGEPKAILESATGVVHPAPHQDLELLFTNACGQI